MRAEEYSGHEEFSYKRSGYLSLESLQHRFGFDVFSTMSKSSLVRLLGFPSVLLAAFLTFMAQPLMGAIRRIL